MGFYNLPPAWDPGFALPKNVQDEGLERRAFVTKWLPRGTYDNPSVGTGGYAVPQYVQDEGYGQGTFTTQWQPEGTYDGPTIPNWLNQRPKVTKVTPLPGGGQKVTVQALGDDPLPEPFESYGQKAAQALIARVQSLPSGQRQAAMKKLLDMVDKTLWSRTQGFFDRYVREQKMPPADAFPLALSRALSTGIAAEVILTGQRRSAPQANSLLGLGCYGCGPLLGALAMGDDASSVPAGCTAAPAGFTWIYGANVNGQDVPGHWARVTAGQAVQPFCPGTPPAGAITAATLVAAGAPAPIVVDHTPAYDFWVGPFGFETKTLLDRVWGIGTPAPGQANRASPPDIMYVTPDLSAQIPPQPQGSIVRPITPDILSWLKARLTEAKDSSGNTDAGVFYTDKSAAYGFPEPDAKKWFDALGITPTTPVRLHRLWQLRTTESPFARTIKTGANMVLNVMLGPAVFTKAYDPTTNGLALKVWLSRVPDPNVFGKLWDPMTYINPLQALQVTAQLGAGANQAIQAGLNDLGNLACQVFSTQAGQLGAGAAAAVVGVPPQVGVAGASVAAQSCNQPPPAPPVAKSILPYVLLAGGGIVAVALLTQRKDTK